MWGQWSLEGRTQPPWWMNTHWNIGTFLHEDNLGCFNLNVEQSSNISITGTILRRWEEIPQSSSAPWKKLIIPKNIEKCFFPLMATKVSQTRPQRAEINVASECDLDRNRGEWNFVLACWPTQVAWTFNLECISRWIGFNLEEEGLYFLATQPAKNDCKKKEKRKM